MIPGKLPDFSVAPTMATEEGLKKFPCKFDMMLCIIYKMILAKTISLL